MNENANKASSQRRPSRSVVNNGRTVHAAHFHFHRNTDTSPRHRRFPALTRHTSRGRRVFNGTARGTLYNEHTQRARARAVTRKREKWKQELNQSNRFHVVRVRILLCDRKMVNCGYDSHLRLCISPRVRQLPATDSEVPSNFISKADVKVGLSNVIRY